MRAQYRNRAAPDKSLVGFRVAGASYAVPIHHVREVVNPVQLSRLPHSGGAWAGAVEHRGEITLLIDLRAHFGVSAEPGATRPKWILMRGLNVPIGFVVDEVTGVLGTEGQALQPAPVRFGGDALDFLGVFSNNGQLTFVLDARHFESMAQMPHETASEAPSLPATGPLIGGGAR